MGFENPAIRKPPISWLIRALSRPIWVIPRGPLDRLDPAPWIRFFP
jgi:hypothetical protein